MKNLLLKLLTIIFALTLCLGIFSACGDTSETPNPPAHTHDYKILKFDTISHWLECECKAKLNVEYHKGGTATETQKAKCIVCNQEYGALLEHTHDYKTLKYNETSHWLECECKAKLNVEYHKGGTATCKEKASCEVCSQKYGELGECNYVNNICTVCGAKQPSEGLVYKPIIIGGIDGFTVSGIGTCTDTEVVIANKYLNKPVLSIGGCAFSNCTSLESIVIPNSVTSIGDEAFIYCYSLESVTIGNSVTSIGYNAFSNCTSLESIVIPNSVTSIGSNAFNGCKSLTSVVIPNSVTSIGNSAFWGCSSLTSVVIPNSVTSIGYGAFWGCSSLTSVVIGNSVTSIGEYAFDGCVSLTIYCKAESKPGGWREYWNYSNRPVVWGYKGN